MNKKDQSLIASVMASEFVAIRLFTHDKKEIVARESAARMIANALASALANGNPAFNRAKFLDECRIPPVISPIDWLFANLTLTLPESSKKEPHQ